MFDDTLLRNKNQASFVLLSTIFGQNREIYFSKLNDSLSLTPFSDIARRYLAYHGYDVHECQDEEEARAKVGI